MVDKATAQRWKDQKGRRYKTSRRYETSQNAHANARRKDRGKQDHNRTRRETRTSPHTGGPRRGTHTHSLSKTLEGPRRKPKTRARTWQRRKGGCLYNTKHPLPRRESLATTDKIRCHPEGRRQAISTTANKIPYNGKIIEKIITLIVYIHQYFINQL